MVPRWPQSTKGSREINTSLPLSLFLSSPNSPLIFLRLLHICTSAHPPVPALYLPPLFSIPLCSAPIATAGQVLVRKQTDLCISSPRDSSTCLRVAADAIKWGARLRSGFSFCPLIVCAAVWGWAGHHYRQRKVMDRKWQWGRDAVGTLGVGWGGKRSLLFSIQGRQQGGWGINGGIDTRDDFLTLQQSTCRASFANSLSLSLFLSLKNIDSAASRSGLCTQKTSLLAPLPKPVCVCVCQRKRASILHPFRQYTHQPLGLCTQMRRLFAFLTCLYCVCVVCVCMCVLPYLSPSSPRALILRPSTCTCLPLVRL